MEKKGWPRDRFEDCRGARQTDGRNAARLPAQPSDTAVEVFLGVLFPTCRRSPSRLQTALKRPPAPAPLAEEVTKAAHEAARYAAHKAAH